MRQINQAGLDLIKSFEGCKLKAYRDQVGVLTIGYGHTGNDVSEDQVIDQDRADQLLLNDLSRFCLGVESSVTVYISDNQFAALVSFSFNLGLGSLRSSTLLKLINEGNLDGAALEFVKWNKAGGVVNPGILRRRQAEQALFNS